MPTAAVQGHSRLARHALSACVITLIGVTGALLTFGWRRYFLFVTPLVSEVPSVRGESRLNPSCFSSEPDLVDDASEALGAMPLALAIRRCSFCRTISQLTCNLFFGFFFFRDGENLPSCGPVLPLEHLWPLIV